MTKNSLNDQKSYPLSLSCSFTLIMTSGFPHVEGMVIHQAVGGAPTPILSGIMLTCICWAAGPLVGLCSACVQHGITARASSCTDVRVLQRTKLSSTTRLSLNASSLCIYIAYNTTE